MSVILALQARLLSLFGYLQSCLAEASPQAQFMMQPDSIFCNIILIFSYLCSLAKLNNRIASKVLVIKYTEIQQLHLFLGKKT